MSRCGGCTLCCDLLKVEVLGKGANERCRNCTPGKGCSIWERRPVVCRGYVCLWHANPKFPDSLRPDRCGVLFEPVPGSKVVVANADPSRALDPHGPAARLIERYLREGYSVVVIAGTERHILLAKGAHELGVVAALEKEARRLGVLS